MFGVGKTREYGATDFVGLFRKVRLSRRIAEIDRSPESVAVGPPRVLGIFTKSEDEVDEAHSKLVSDWTDRLGGAIRLPGKTSISFRIDHGLKNFDAKMRKKLETHGFQYTIALSPEAWHLPENEGVTPGDVNDWILGGFCSIASHGWGNHYDTSNPAEIYRDVVTSKAQLEADIPAATPIDIYMPHGGTGSGDLGGFKPATGPEKYYGTLAGQLALKTYPICTGQFPGSVNRIQDGQPRIGQGYFNMDKFTASQIMTRVRKAIKGNMGIQLMIHPSQIDKPGCITTHELDQLIYDLTVLRMEGSIQIVSAAEQCLVDAR